MCVCVCVCLLSSHVSLCTAARERLCDLTSREGDWFLDELCTMSGNVSQMIGLMEMSYRVCWHSQRGKGVESA